MMDDLGGILLGVAAIITAVGGLWHHGRKLASIDKAVNGKAADEPYLRQVAVETYEVTANLYDLTAQTHQTIGRVEGKLDAHIDNRDIHSPHRV